MYPPAPGDMHFLKVPSNGRSRTACLLALRRQTYVLFPNFVGRRGRHSEGSKYLDSPGKSKQSDACACACRREISFGERIFMKFWQLWCTSIWGRALSSAWKSANQLVYTVVTWCFWTPVFVSYGQNSTTKSCPRLVINGAGASSLRIRRTPRTERFPWLIDVVYCIMCRYYTFI